MDTSVLFFTQALQIFFTSEDNPVVKEEMGRITQYAVSRTPAGEGEEQFSKLKRLIESSARTKTKNGEKMRE